MTITTVISPYEILIRIDQDGTCRAQGQAITRIIDGSNVISENMHAADEIDLTGIDLSELIARIGVPVSDSVWLTKLQIANRLTDAEISTVLGLYDGTAEQRRWAFLWGQATSINTSDAQTISGFTSIFGPERASQLLAP